MIGEDTKIQRSHDTFQRTEWILFGGKLEVDAKKENQPVDKRFAESKSIKELIELKKELNSE
ncbi:hypothetical protein [Chengkuizengella sediminis]|uniref:hypothetical protein n=1 Tax=Chengkuizengella sediminis TaxID=1885917 RepID=UPI001F0CE4B6|nr:hypothetical protein [Chengkuizengella sediminis]